MSRGIEPIEFVRQVYYAQEKVYLDFVPTDDKYKEVLMEANLVLQELQKEEDWLWLRKQVLLGKTAKDTKTFELPPDFYKSSTLFNDGLRFYAHRICDDTTCTNWNLDESDKNYVTPFVQDIRGNYEAYDGTQDISPVPRYCKGSCIERMPFLVVPWVPAGWKNDFASREMSFVTRPNVQDITLGATVIDNKIVLSRPLLLPEIDKIAVLDYQRMFKPIHICTSNCKANPYHVDPDDPTSELTEEVDYDPDNFHPCKLIEPVLFTEIPDPMYMVIKTAQYHAEGSPPAQGRIASLQDQAQKLLSAMRENNAVATTSDFIPRWTPGFWQVV